MGVGEDRRWFASHRSRTYAAWTGTTRRASLAVIDTTPAYEFTYAYQLPTNPYCLQVLSVSDSYSTDFPWRREGDQILTDVTSLAITYSARITDTSQYGPHLTKTLTYCLASKLAKPITGSTQEAKYFLELYNDTLEKCRAMDCTQGTSEIWTSTSLTDDVR